MVAAANEGRGEGGQEPDLNKKRVPLQRTVSVPYTHRKKEGWEETDRLANRHAHTRTHTHLHTHTHTHTHTHLKVQEGLADLSQ